MPFTNKNRIAIFLKLCIGTRALFAYIAKIIPNEHLHYIGYLALVPAIYLSYAYLTDHDVLEIGKFGGVIWWNDLRPIHSMLYFTIAYLAITGNTNTWKVVVFDTFLGLLAFSIHHSGATNTTLIK